MIRIPAIPWILAFSIIASCICILRTQYTGDFAYGYMLVNIILAWIPMLTALPLKKHVQRKHTSILFGLCTLWLLFFPNTFYLVTDFIHLMPRSPIPVWIDALMLTLFAVAGVALGFASLYIVERSMKKYVPEHVFSVAALILASVGLYMGRFLRWNSWDLLLRPLAVMKDIFFTVGTPHAITFIAGSSLILLILYQGIKPHLTSFSK